MLRLQDSFVAPAKSSVIIDPVSLETFDVESMIWAHELLRVVVKPFIFIGRKADALWAIEQAYENPFFGLTFKPVQENTLPKDVIASALCQIKNSDRVIMKIWCNKKKGRVID